MDTEKKREILANFGAVIVKLKTAADLHQGVELTPGEVQSFSDITGAGINNLVEFQSPFKLADDDFPELFGDDAKTDSPPQLPPMPLLQPVEFAKTKTEFDFVSGKTLEEFKANFNRLIIDALHFQVIGDLKRAAGGYYQPILITTKDDTKESV